LPAEVFVYDTADHGFNCWARGSYHAASAALAHGRTLQFFAERLF
jgi:carboxymethylenebutenolidase